MHEDWKRFLDAAVPVAGRQDDPAADLPGLHAARSGAFICDLSAYALASAQGPDAETFLQGQLSNDVKSLPPARVQLAAYNTPKGRMLASVILWRSKEGFFIQCPQSIAEPFLKRLSMFVMRSKVKIANLSSQTVRFGVGGPTAGESLRAAGLPCPDADFDLVENPAEGGAAALQVIRLPGNRYELIYATAEAAIRDWRALAASATVASVSPWRWLGVRSGIAEIETATQDKYVPQMVNLELVGGISFTKGCYPGQEIVARTQYRGEIKRRMLLAHVASATSPAPAQDVVTAAEPAQTVGSIVDAAPSPDGGHDVLVCLHLDLAHNAGLHLGSPDGVPLELLSLPYALPQAR